jgi:hypothetical protein
MLLLGISFFGYAQDTLLVPIDSVEVDIPIIVLKLLSLETTFTIRMRFWHFMKKCIN